MTSQILRIVNSEFFCLYHEVTDPDIAVNLLGLNTINSLILSLHIFKEVDQSFLEKFNLESLLEHSLTIGFFAKEIALTETGEKNFQRTLLLLVCFMVLGK